MIIYAVQNTEAGEVIDRFIIPSIARLVCSRLNDLVPYHQFVILEENVTGNITDQKGADLRVDEIMEQHGWV